MFMVIEFVFCNLGAITFTMGFLWTLLCIDANLASLYLQTSLPMQGRCACALNFGPVTFDLGNLGDHDALGSKIQIPKWPLCACGLHIGGGG